MNFDDGFLIRKAEFVEIEEFRVLVNRVFREKQEVLNKNREMIPISEISTELLSEKKQVFVLLDESSKVRGGIVVTLDSGDLADLRYLCVDFPLMGLKYGEKLLKYSENHLKKAQGKKRVSLSIVFHPKFPQEGLEKMYLAEGYQRIGKDKPPKPEDAAKWFDPEYKSDVFFRFFEKKL